MVQQGISYKSGSHSYLYLLVTYCWWIIALAALFSYVAYSVYAGRLHPLAAAFLADNPSWYVDTGLLAEWSLLASISFFIIAYLLVSVEYRKYSFSVDGHAFHLRRGLIRVQEMTIPYQQITNVHIEQPYHWRLLGLAQLDITISSSRHGLRVEKRKDFLIPLIDKRLAKELSQFLVKRASGEDQEEAPDDEFDDGEEFEIRGR